MFVIRWQGGSTLQTIPTVGFPTVVVVLLLLWICFVNYQLASKMTVIG